MKKITLLFLLLPFLGLGQVQIGDDITSDAGGFTAGTSIALSADGNVLAVGDINNSNSNANFSGHVRIFRNVNDEWLQIGDELNGSFTQEKYGFSLSLSSDGNILAIGSPETEMSGLKSGSAQIYQNINDEWIQLGQTILAENFNDDFGFSVSLSSNGNILAVGAPDNEDNGVGSGHVRVFENISNAWTQVGQTIIGEMILNDLGDKVSLSSDGLTLAVSAPLNDNIESDAGRVKVFNFNGTNWIQKGQNIDGGEGINNRFGYSLEISSDGNIIAIGSPFLFETNGLPTGGVKVFLFNETNWVQIGQTLNGEEIGDRFGESLALSANGNIISIGVPGNNSNGNQSGYVISFKLVDNSWSQVGQDINGEAAGYRIGETISISDDGSIVAVGAPFIPTADGGGKVQVYSIASELAILEVVDDILGNTNGINVTANQLNSINGVSGAIEGVNYTTALDNGSFADENDPTAAEIQLIIDQVNAALSLDENELFSFSIYPNPTKNQLTIQLDLSVQLQKVTIYNTLGQLVLTSDTSTTLSTRENTINTSKLASGSYIVEILTNKGKSSKKLIIE